MHARYLITGATGNVGGEVLRLMLAHGHDAVAAVRDVGRARQQLGTDVTCVQFDFTQPQSFGPALHDIEALFLVRPPAIANIRRDISPALRAAKEAGVARVVFLSLLGADKNPLLPHRQIEREIEAIGLPATFLRAGFFMQNLSTEHGREIRDLGEIIVPAGQGRTSFVDIRDLAAVALKTLTEEGRTGQAYGLTGSQALSYAKVAEALSQALGKPVRYDSPSLIRFVRHRRSLGEPMGKIMVMVGIYATARMGAAARITDQVQQLLGRPPITLAQFAHDYCESWAR